MPGCSVIGCTYSAAKKVKMCYFPSEPERRNAWIERIGRKNWLPTKYSVICQYHFEDDMWEKPRADGKLKLKWNAIPTIFGEKVIQVNTKVLYNSNKTTEMSSANLSTTAEAVCLVASEIVNVSNNINNSHQGEQADVLVDHNYIPNCENAKKNLNNGSHEIANSVIREACIDDHEKSLTVNDIAKPNYTLNVSEEVKHGNSDNAGKKNININQYDSVSSLLLLIISIFNKYFNLQI